MNKRQFDDIENKIREAAEKSEYAFNEEGWNKMKVLLDKNDNRRRRPFIWLWLAVPLLLAGIAAGILFTSKQEKTIPALADKSAGHGKAQQTTISTNKSAIGLNKNYNTGNIAINVAGNEGVADREQRSGSKNLTQKSDQSIQEGEGIIITTKSNRKAIIAAKKAVKGSRHFNVQNSAASGREDTPASIATLVNVDKIKQQEKINEETKTKTIEIKQTAIQAKDTIVAVEKKPGQKNKKKNGGFYLVASAGPEAASVRFGSFKNSIVNGRYGVAIGYGFGKRIGIQAGFYASRKKYIAGGGDYKASPDSYYSTVDITKVNANCLIYEIPLTFRYNLLQNKTIEVFTTTGISSFIMKHEAYRYYYKRNNLPYESSHDYTGNRNLFSVLSFAVGIEKKLSNTFSVLAEPSVSIPLGGVGEGSVKLYSASLQFGIRYQPFRK